MDYSKLTRDELVERLRVWEEDPAARERERLIHDLEVHQEELESQNEELRQMQQLLEESRSRYAELYDFAPAAYLTLDKMGCISEINLAGAALLESERAGLLGRPFAPFVSLKHKKAFLGHLRDLATGGSGTIDLSLTLKAKGLIDVQLMSAGLIDPAGNFSGFRTAITDISHRKQAEETLRRAVRSRENFLAVVAHDLRNPLNVIYLGAEVLLRTLPKDGEASKVPHQHLTNIQRSVKRVNRLLADLLDLSSMDAGHLSIHQCPQQVPDLVAAVVEIMEPMAREKGVRLEVSIDGSLAAHCDRERVMQVLLNLVGNAIKFTPPAGSIRIGAKPQAAEVLLTVQDTGVGIPRPLLAYIFDPYWHAEKTEQKGTGLGLSICKGIVELHGGKIWVESQVERGSTFFFTLPAAPLPREEEGSSRAQRPSLLPSAVSQRQPETTQAADESLARSERPILLIEDEVDTAAALTMILRTEGFEVVTAANGEQGLGYLRQAATKPSIILLDLVMPVMDGAHFLTERSDDPELAEIPVIILSSQVAAHKPQAGWKIAGYLEKPLQIDKLFELLAQYAR